MAMQTLGRRSVSALAITYLRMYAIGLITLAGLFIALDAFAHLDEHFAVAETSGNLFGLMGRHCLIRVADIGAPLCGVTAIIAAGLTFACVKRNDDKKS
jgi:hypothetical protein